MNRNYWNDRIKMPIDSDMEWDKALDYCGHYYLPFIGNNRMTTRLQIPITLRKLGLWITYRGENGKVLNEVYCGKTVGDGEWGKSENWLSLDRFISDDIFRKYMGDKDRLFWKEIKRYIDITVRKEVEKRLKELEGTTEEDTEEETDEMVEAGWACLIFDTTLQDTDDEKINMLLTSHGAYFDSMIIDGEEIDKASAETYYNVDADYGEVYVYVKVKNGSKLEALFANCTCLVSVTSNLLADCTEVTNIDSLFEYCSNLKVVPSDIFMNNLNLTDVAECFKDCTSLTPVIYLPAENITKATDFAENVGGTGTVYVVEGSKTYDTFTSVNASDGEPVPGDITVETYEF